MPPPAAETKKVEAAQQEARTRESAQLLNDFMKHFGIQLQFKIEDGETVVRVLNKQTGELIRQIPSEESIRLSKALDTLQGVIIKTKA